MANIAAIRSVGTSLVSYLDQAYRASVFPNGIVRPNCTFELLSLGDLKANDIAVEKDAVKVLILLYRVTMNEHFRSTGRPSMPDMQPNPLAIDLHYLLSFWSGSEESEQLALAWTMRQMHQTPVLDGSILSAEAGWIEDDLIHLIPDELTNEDMMRIWDALEPSYRLSLSYIARVVRIDPDDSPEFSQVVATRFNYAVPSDSP